MRTASRPAEAIAGRQVGEVRSIAPPRLPRRASAGCPAYSESSTRCCRNVEARTTYTPAMNDDTANVTIGTVGAPRVVASAPTASSPITFTVAVTVATNSSTWRACSSAIIG